MKILVFVFFHTLCAGAFCQCDYLSDNSFIQLNNDLLNQIQGLNRDDLTLYYINFSTNSRNSKIEINDCYESEMKYSINLTSEFKLQKTEGVSYNYGLIGENSNSNTISIFLIKINGVTYKFSSIWGCSLYKAVLQFLYENTEGEDKEILVKELGLIFSDRSR